MKGSLKERSPGRWAIILDVYDPQTGKRRRRWHSFRGTKRQAQIECARLITEIETGAAVDPTRITLSEFLDRFERDWISIHVTPTSAKRYKLSLAYARQHLGNRRLQDIRPVDLAAFYAALSRSLAPRTVRHAHLVLHKALEQAKIWNLIRDKPADLANPPPIPRTEISILQPDQARELLERLRGHELYMLAALALATGARRNELLGLRWSDLELNTGRMSIEQALEQASGAVQVKSPKTRAGRRTPTLPPTMVTELRAHWAAPAEQRMALGLGRSPADGFVLAAIDGGPQRPDPLSKRWGETMDRLGMPEITLHSLRHTHASMLIAAGMDILTVSRRLGHASPTITLNTYGHMIHGTDAQAAVILDQAFGSKVVQTATKSPENRGKLTPSSEFLPLDQAAAADHLDAPLRQEPERQRVYSVLDLKNTGSERLNRIIVADGHRRLRNDRARVGLWDDEMNRRARYLHSGLKSLAVRIETGKRWQQGGMNVGHAGIGRASCRERGSG